MSSRTVKGSNQERASQKQTHDRRQVGRPQTQIRSPVGERGINKSLAGILTMCAEVSSAHCATEASCSGLHHLQPSSARPKLTCESRTQLTLPSYLGPAADRLHKQCRQFPRPRHISINLYGFLLCTRRISLLRASLWTAFPVYESWPGRLWPWWWPCCAECWPLLHKQVG